MMLNCLQLIVGIELNKTAALLLVLVFLTASCTAVKSVFSSTDVAEDSWTSKTPMHVERTGLGVATVDGKIYAIGGITIGRYMPSIAGFVVLGFRDLEDLGTLVRANEEYDPNTDKWTMRASMPTPRILFATAVYQNKIYCIGGKTNTGYTGVIEVYDPTTDTWETKTPMPTVRSRLTACVVNEKIYLIGGEPKGTLNEVYDPETDSWTTKTSLPFETLDPEGAVVEDKIFIIGSSKLQIYDPKNDSWSQGTNPLDGGGYGAVVTTGISAPKRIYVISDYKPNNCVYNPESASWTWGDAFPACRFNFGVAIVNDLVYVIGGHTYNTGQNGYVQTVAMNEQYTPKGYGTIPPMISIVSPENNGEYDETQVPLSFVVDELVVGLGYSFDGQDNVTIRGNITLSELSSGLHIITVYAKDALGNTGASETISFTITEAEPFPTMPIAAASVASGVVVSVGLLVYFKKRKH